MGESRTSGVRPRRALFGMLSALALAVGLSGPAQASSSSTWQPLDGDGSTWSACTPISYRVDPGPTGHYGESLAGRGVDAVADATGFDLEPTSGDADLVIAFVPHRRLGSAPADAGGRADYMSDGATIAHARVLLDAGLIARARALPGSIPMKLVLHELGHAMGLGHVDNPDDRMYPVISVHGPARYGPGDLQGLAAKGAAGAARCGGAVK